MQVKTNVIIIAYNGKIEVWGSLAEICRVHKLKYSKLSKKKFPFEYEGIIFEKHKYRTKTFNHEV